MYHGGHGVHVCKTHRGRKFSCIYVHTHTLPPPLPFLRPRSAVSLTHIRAHVVMRASWNSGADLAALKSQLDLFKTRADMTDRLKAQLAAGMCVYVGGSGRM